MLALIAAFALSPFHHARTPDPWMAGGPQQSRVIVGRKERMMSGPPGIVVKASARTLTLDCAGGRIAIDGNFNHMQLVGCDRVTINGHHNFVSARFDADGNLDIAGHANRVRWSAAPDATVHRKNIGYDNKVRPATPVTG